MCGYYAVGLSVHLQDQRLESPTVAELLPKSGGHANERHVFSMERETCIASRVSMGPSQ